MTNNIIHAFFSSMCVTIPEYVFLVIITLKLMGRNDFLDFYDIKNNLISILTIAIPPALVLDILNYVIKSPSSLNKIISVILTYYLLTYILKKRSIIEYPKLYQKAFQYFIYSLLLAIAIEIITLPIVFKLIDKTFKEIQQNFYLLILCSMSSRIIDLLILYFIFLKRNSKFQLNMGDYILKNKFFNRLLSVLMVSLVITEAYFIKLILYNELLSIIPSIYEQLFLVIGFTFLIPSLIISIVYSCINYCVMIINSEKQIVRND